MQAKSKFWTFIAMVIALAVVTTSCKKEDDSTCLDCDLETGTGKSAEEIDTYAGDIGIRFDTRAITRKGYKPTSARFTVTANTGNYSQTLPIDPYTNIVQLSFPAESLSEAAVAELREGVLMKVDILDENGNWLAGFPASTVSFTSEGLSREINASGLNDLLAEVDFYENVPYYFQLVEENGANTNFFLYGGEGHINISFGTEPTGTEQLKYLFNVYKLPGTSDVFYFKRSSDGKILGVTNNYPVITHPLFLSAFPTPTVVPNEARFQFEKSDKGLYKLINLYYGLPLYLENGPSSNILGLTPFPTSGNPKIAYFRILAPDIDWEIQSIETRQLAPVLPAARTQFGFNSTLTNCGQGVLEQEVGFEKSITTTQTVGWEEAISMSSSHTFGGSFTIGVTVGAEFFGNKTEVTAEATASYEYSTEMTQSSTKFEEVQESATETFFSSRLVTVPSKAASLVYDAYQLYENVRIPFVQRFRVKGNYQADNQQLTGQEILTQFQFNHFKGVVTKVGLDYIELTVRGTTVINNLVKSESRVEDVPADCG